MGRMQARGSYRYHTHAECQRAVHPQRVVYPQSVVYPQRVEYLDHHQQHLFFPSCLVAVAVCVHGLGIRGLGLGIRV